MKRETKSIIKHLDFLLLDVFILQVSFSLACLWYNYMIATNDLTGELETRLRTLLLICNILIVSFGSPYKNILKRDKYEELKKVIEYHLIGIVIYLVLLFLLHIAGNASRLIVVFTWLISTFLGYFVRVVWKKVLRTLIVEDRKDASSHVIVLSRKERIEDVLNRIHSNAFDQRKVTAIFLLDFDRNTDSEIRYHSIPVVGNESEMISFATHNWVDEVILDLPLGNKLERELSDQFSSMGIIAHTIMVEFSGSEPVPMVEKYGYFIVSTQMLRDVPMIQWIMKRGIDILGSFIGLFFTVIIFVIIAPVIYRASPGPILFKQDRVGKNGKVFKMYKFRSMYLDAEKRKAELMNQNQMTGFMFKMDDDPRIIGSEKKDKHGNPKGIGNFIRKTSLDEFPQFWNVLKGDMSLVGTRPPTLDEWKQYSSSHKKRLAMRPGITGMWQVSGRSEITDFDEIVKLDSEYIDSWTISMDIRILIMTIVQVIKKDGAK